MNVFERRVI